MVCSAEISDAIDWFLPLYEGCLQVPYFPHPSSFADEGTARVPMIPCAMVEIHVRG
jgi:hypothetical protein